MLRIFMFSLFAWCALIGVSAAAEGPPLKLAKGNKIVLIGNTLAERQQHFGNFETLLHARFPELNLVVRNLGWSADELTLRPRSASFADHGHKLTDHKPDVIFAFFGFNESFGGEKGLPKFKADLEKFIQETATTKYNGNAPPQLVLFSPIAHEDLGKRELPDGSANNKNIALYTAAMKEGEHLDLDVLVAVEDEGGPDHHREERVVDTLEEGGRVERRCVGGALEVGGGVARGQGLAGAGSALGCRRG
jgi:hypothetical protein